VDDLIFIYFLLNSLYEREKKNITYSRIILFIYTFLLLNYIYLRVRKLRTQYIIMKRQTLKYYNTAQVIKKLRYTVITYYCS